jgi:hypothetical protein
MRNQHGQAKNLLEALYSLCRSYAFEATQAIQNIGYGRPK